MRNLVKDLTQRLQGLRGYLDVEGKRARRDRLDEEIGRPNFWNEQEKAASVQRERSQLDTAVQRFDRADHTLKDLPELIDLVVEEEDAAALADVSKDLEGVRQAVEEMEFQRILGSADDVRNAYLDINAGAGGTDSQDWAQMLMRMYLRYVERRGWQVEVMDQQDGDEAGIKSCTLHITGEYAYGYLKVESGVHRLVRISPFDSNQRRHTSFASAYVYPEVDDDIDIEVKDEDLKIDTLRSGGAGGQHVNKTESAVRFTHLPTGIVVLCQQERSQHKNRALALKLLKAKLYKHEVKKREAVRDATESAKMEISFGSQIRNYVLHPYRLAKDLRTGYERGNVEAVLDGDLHDFLEKALLEGVGMTPPGES
ncbi:MAG: peptide chain release factor 2 [Pseudomonadota bacterium]